VTERTCKKKKEKREEELIEIRHVLAAQKRERGKELGAGGEDQRH